MSTFYLLGAQREEICAVVIAVDRFEVVDETGHVAAWASSESRAADMRERYAARYPAHVFTVRRCAP